MTIITDIGIAKQSPSQSITNKSFKTTATQTKTVSNDPLYNTHDEFRLNDSKLMTPFSELLNTSGAFRKMDLSLANATNTRFIDSTHNSSGLATIDRRSNSKDRPASVINKKCKYDFTRKSSNESIGKNEENDIKRYTPIGKLEIL